MRKILLGALALALMVVSATPAMAAKKPVKTTLYLHGNEMFGEAEADGFLNTGYLPMTPDKPSSSAPRSKQVISYVVGPNTECAGNDLFPVWLGNVAGKFVGKMKMTFFAVSTPTRVSVRIWPDVTSLLCNQSTLGASDYPDPGAEKIVNIPPGAGAVTVTTKPVHFKAIGTLMVQITPEDVTSGMPAPQLNGFQYPDFTRILYDSPDFPSALQFTCIPAHGSSCATK